MNVLSAIWFAAAIGGVTTVAVRWVHPAWPLPPLLLAGACVGVDGTLGFASIALVFLVAVGCLVPAERAPAQVA